MAGRYSPKKTPLAQIAERSTVIFTFNYARMNGGALLCLNGFINIKGSSVVKFTNNEAMIGGVAHCDGRSNVIIDGNCTLIFSSNRAEVQEWCSKYY